MPQPSTLSILISTEQIRARTAEMARQIEADLAGEPVLLLGVLNGAVHFLSDLSREINSDSLLDFLQTSSYHGGKSSSGVVQIRKDLDINIEGKNVIIVEDIVDTGITLSHLRGAALHSKTKVAKGCRSALKKGKQKGPS